MLKRSVSRGIGVGDTLFYWRAGTKKSDTETSVFVDIATERERDADEPQPA